MHIERSLGEFSWQRGDEDFIINVEQLRADIYPILDLPQFKTPRSDHTFIRVEHFIDRLLNFKVLGINLATGEIQTENH